YEAIGLDLEIESCLTVQERENYKSQIHSRFGNKVGTRIFQYRQELLVREWMRSPKGHYEAVLSKRKYFNQNHRFAQGVLVKNKEVFSKIFNPNLHFLVNKQAQLIGATGGSFSKIGF